MKRRISFPIVPRGKHRKKKLPHISRIFTASPPPWGEKLVLWGLFCMLLVAGGSSYLYHRAVDSHRLRVLEDPYSREPYMAYAQILKSEGLQLQAQHQLILAQDFTSFIGFDGKSHSGNVLGAQVSPSDLAAQWNNEDKVLEGELEFWKGETEKHPDYRDAYVRAAVAAYKLRRISESAILMGKALAIDPNNTQVEHLNAQMHE